MTALWSFYWPVVAIGVAIGVYIGQGIFRPLQVSSGDRIAGTRLLTSNWRQRRKINLAVGIAAILGITALWHGPLGASNRFAGAIERAVRAELAHQEMSMVHASLQRGPLRRRIVLSGPADDFQQRELVRIIDAIPGVSHVHWLTPASPPDGVK